MVNVITDSTEIKKKQKSHTDTNYIIIVVLADNISHSIYVIKLIYPKKNENKGI